MHTKAKLLIALITFILTTCLVILSIIQSTKSMETKCKKYKCNYESEFKSGFPVCIISLDSLNISCSKINQTCPMVDTPCYLENNNECPTYHECTVNYNTLIITCSLSSFILIIELLIVIHYIYAYKNPPMPYQLIYE